MAVGMKLDTDQAILRGYNLMVCAMMGLAGAAFGTVIFDEKDLPDKIDDGLLLAIGLISIIWYLVGEHRFRRSAAPVVLASLGTLAQVVGVVIEHSDKNSFGDNIGGMMLFVPMLILVSIQYRKTGELLTNSGG